VVEKQDLSRAKAIAVAQPLAFEVNRGQADHSVKFLARAKGYAALLMADESVVRLNNDTAIRMKLRNGNPSPAVQGEDLQAGKSNYLLGADHSKWIVGIPHYAKVRAKGVYPGIDIVYSGNERQMEYDFVVSPGADPSQIRMAFDGASKFAINRDGDLEFHTAAGVMLAHKPVVYQIIDGQRKSVSGDFVLLAKNEAGFQVGPYQTSRALVIDPTIIVAANVGGSADDEGFAIAANATGIVLTGRTKSVNVGTPDLVNSGFPVLGPLPGQGQHSTPGGSWDVFVTKFTIDPITGMAVLASSTYMGTPLDEAGEGVALDAAGNIYVGGYTNSPSFLPGFPAPVAPFSGAYSAFVVELNPAGSAILADTYFGGAGTTQAFSLAMDTKTGNIVIGGLTSGLSPAPGGIQGTYGGGTTDGFVASFAPGSLTLVASTYLGGSGYDQVNSVTAGADGSVYAAGFTASGNVGATGFPTKSAIPVGSVGSGQQTAFVTKFKDTSLGSISYSSVFGVGGEDANGVAVDVDGVAYVVGATKNPNFSNATQTTCPGTYAAGGTLPTGATYGTAIQYTAACPTNPNQTQGYLLSLTPAGAINYLDLQPVTAHDPANLSGCNLNLTKNGGNFSSGNVCTGFVGSWNAVATDTDEQAYAHGQVGTGGPPPTAYQADGWRFTRTGTLANSFGSATPDVAYGDAVINSNRQEFVIGTWAPTGTGANPLWGYRITSPAVIAPDSYQANGGEDVSLIGVQWDDIFVTPSVINLGPAVQNSSPAPSATVQAANYAGVPANSCTVSNSNPSEFTITALPSTGTFTVTLSTANVGTFTGTATFTCGGDNVSSTITMSGTITPLTGTFNYAPSATLIATSPIGSGVLMPYNTLPGNAQITIDVTTAAVTIPFSVGSANKSANWPTGCTLVSLGAPSGPATPPPGASFVVTINSGCANQLALGPYTENITLTATNAGQAPTVNIPFSLTITNGGVINQYLTNFIFGNSTTPQLGSFTVQAPTGGFTYNTLFVPPNNGITPLPAANVTILSGQRGTVAAGGSSIETVQVTPVGLANGVYSFCYTVTSPSLPAQFNNSTTCSNVYVGVGLGFITPAGGVMNISVPSGFAPANITQPSPIGVTGLANFQVSPYSIALPTGAAISLPAGVPTSAFTLSALSGNPCSTWAQNSPSNTNSGPSCGYSVVIDSTLLTPTAVGAPDVITVTFKGATGVTVNLTVNLTVTQFPQLSWVNNTGAPLAGLTFVSTTQNDSTFCSNNLPPYDYVVATGGVVPQVTLSISPILSWMGYNGSQGTPGNLGNTNPINLVVANPLQAPGFYFQNICVTSSGLTKPGTYTGTVTATGSGVNSPAVLPITFIVSGTGVSNVGVFRGGFLWVLDANGNTTFDGTGPGLDIATAFGGIAGDMPITGDWSGSGTTKIGIYRSSNGLFLLDYNDNGTFDGCLADRCYQYMPTPTAGDIPVIGDWTGTGTSKIGLYRPSSGQWFLNLSGNGTYIPGVDFVTYYGGLAGDVPVTGDWTGSGTTKIGIFRSGFYWMLNTTGTGTLSAADALFPFGGDSVIPGDVPVVGDWNGDGRAKVGVFRLGFFWVLDTNGDHVFTPGEQAFPFGGLVGANDQPVVGKWRRP